MCFPAGKNIVTEIREVIPGLCTRLDWISVYISGDASRVKEKSEDAPCIDDNKFYRNPNSPAHNVWSPAECAKYYLCLGNCPDYVSLRRASRIIFLNHSLPFPSTDNEVFEFRCSQGLLFDVSRQVCDFKANVNNCDVMSGTVTIFWLERKRKKERETENG